MHVPALVSCPLSFLISTIALYLSPLFSQNLGVQPANSQAPTAPGDTGMQVINIFKQYIFFFLKASWTPVKSVSVKIILMKSLLLFQLHLKIRLVAKTWKKFMVLEPYNTLSMQSNRLPKTLLYNTDH